MSTREKSYVPTRWLMLLADGVIILIILCYVAFTLCVDAFCALFLELSCC